MAASEKTTEGKKNPTSELAKKRKTQNSCFLPSSLRSSSEAVPCDSPEHSLWLTAGTAAMFISSIHMVLCPPPKPRHPPHHLFTAKRRRWCGGRVGGLHQGETLPVGSRQFQAIALCSLGFCLHTRTHTHTADDY